MAEKLGQLWDLSHSSLLLRITVLCFLFFASYILFIVIVYLSRKTSQVSATLSLWDTEVSEYILLKIFEIYKEQMFVYDAWQ